MMFYVVDQNKGYTTHEGDEQSCRDFVRNVRDLYGKSGFVICRGAKARNEAIKESRS